MSPAPRPFDRPVQTVAVSFTLNGKAVEVSVDPSARLLDTLRYGLGLTGSKEGCGEGSAGVHRAS